MKNQDEHPIDKLFREKTEQHFGYDPTLWASVEKDIAVIPFRKNLLIISAIAGFVATGVMALYLHSGSDLTNHKNSESDSYRITNNTQILHKDEAPFKNETGTIAQGLNSTNNKDDAKDQSGMNINETGSDPDSYRDHRIESHPGKSDPDKSEFADRYKGERAFSERNHGKKRSVETPKESDRLVKREASPSADQPKEPKVKEDEQVQAGNDEDKFTLIKLFPKGIQSFFQGSNHDEIAAKQLQPRKPFIKRKFNLTIELDGKYALKFKNHVGGLSASELKYRRQYERENEASGYSVHVIFHKRGFGLLTGIGYSQASLKTNYMAPVLSYETETRYAMLQPNFSIRPNGTPVSLIREYQDTTVIRSEEALIKGQANRNTFHWLQIPLMATFEYPYKRFRFSLRAGAEFQLLYKAEGFLINSTLDGLTSMGDGEQKLKRFTVNPTAQFNAGYQLSPHIQLGANFYGSKQLGSNFARYDSRFSQMGIGWYLGYRF